MNSKYALIVILLFSLTTVAAEPEIDDFRQVHDGWLTEAVSAAIDDAIDTEGLKKFPDLLVGMGDKRHGMNPCLMFL